MSMPVHTLENPAFVAPPGKRLAVLGDPIAHSLSPAMHNAALGEMASANPDLLDWRYEAVHLPADDLLRGLKVLHQAGVIGINLTIPHKVHALDAVESIDEKVRPMGAVNTLIRTSTGYRATNTDGYGIRKAVQEAFKAGFSGRDVWVFGAGGAARGICVACLQEGCARITVVNRSEPRLRELEGQLLNSGLPGLDRARFFPLASTPVDLQDGALLINATSLGLKETDPSPVPPAFLKPGVQVYDTTYGAASELGRQCSRSGIAYAAGLSMLVWQGVRSLEIWTGHPVPAETMRRAALEQLHARARHG